MARLNEPQVPIESLESLKRRCIRQNREIAKTNSTQSLRIRNLEAETSRLLAENIALREQIIKLQCEVERRSTRNTLHNVGLVKGKLEAKLSELGSLVLELGEIQSRRRTSHRPSGGHSEDLSTKRSPDQRNWKNALTLSEVTTGQDGRLPPILEDKMYPRRTLETEEILGILSDPTSLVDSPDLGPPPIARYEFEGDPMKHDLGAKVLGTVDDLGHPNVSAFSNLETRKKRRTLDTVLSDSTDREDALNPAGSTLLDAQNSSSATPGQTFKSGAKRKLSVREDDEQRGSQTRDKDDFHFNRRNESQVQIISDGPAKNESSLNKSSDSIPEAAFLISEQETNKAPELPSTQLKVRMALGEKSVNMDPIASPAKSSKVGRGQKIMDSKDDIPKKPRDRAREKPLAPKVVRIPDRMKVPKATTIEPSPGIVESTAVPLAQLEPSISLPTRTGTPAVRLESLDTPPPEDFAGRGSRRPRGNVSYAEPNLRDKMRRPTKELADAVGTDGRIQRAVSAKLGNEDDDVLFERATESSKANKTGVKKEDFTPEATAWRSLPNVQALEEPLPVPEPPASPLSTKSSSIASVGNLPASVMTDRKRRASAFPSPNDDDDVKVEPHPQIAISGSNNAIAALVAGSHKRASRILNPTTAEEVTKAGSNKTTDPLQTHITPNVDEDVSPTTDSKTTTKVPLGSRGGTNRLYSKRYSSVPESLSGRVAGGGDTNVGSTTTTRSVSRGSKRRDTTLIESTSAPNIVPLGPGGSANGNVRSSADTARLERLAGRRRSMML